MAWSAVARSQPWFASTRARRRPDGVAKPADALDVVGDRMRGGLDLEDAVAARHLLARLGDFGVRALDRERPRQRHALAHPAPEQAMHGDAERPAVQVPERHLDGGARERVALHSLRHLAAERLDRVASRPTSHGAM